MYTNPTPPPNFDYLAVLAEAASQQNAIPVQQNGELSTRWPLRDMGNDAPTWHSPKKTAQTSLANSRILPSTPTTHPSVSFPDPLAIQSWIISLRQSTLSQLLFLADDCYSQGRHLDALQAVEAGLEAAENLTASGIACPIAKQNFFRSKQMLIML